MTEPVVIIEAFGRDYPLPLSAAKRSKVFAKIFSGKYREQDRVELNFDPLLQSAWEVVYQQLLTHRNEGSWGELQFFSSDLLWDFFQIAEYLQIDDLIDDFRKLVYNGNIPAADLIQHYDRYRNDPALVQSAALTIIGGTTQFDQLPEWVQEIFPTYQTTELPPVGFLLARLSPLNYQELYLNQSILTEKLGFQYNQICPEQQQPQALTPSGLVRMSPNRIVQRVDDLLLLCPGGYPRLDQTGCCQRGRPTQEIRVQIPWREIGDRIAMMGQGGFLVFLSPGFQGDYILTYNYEYLPEIKAVVV